MTLDFIIIWKTVYFGCGEVDKEMMIGLDAVFEGRSRHAFALIVATAAEASVDVYVRQRNAAYLLEIEVD